MARRLQVYQAEEITVTFDPNLCVHSARCLSGLPTVFDVGRRKWIDATAASADDIARVIDRAHQVRSATGGRARLLERDPCQFRPRPW